MIRFRILSKLEDTKEYKLHQTMDIEGKLMTLAIFARQNVTAMITIKQKGFHYDKEYNHVHKRLSYTSNIMK